MEKATRKLRMTLELVARGVVRGVYAATAKGYSADAGIDLTIGGPGGPDVENLEPPTTPCTHLGVAVASETSGLPVPRVLAAVNFLGQVHGVLRRKRLALLLLTSRSWAT